MFCKLLLPPIVAVLLFLTGLSKARQESYISSSVNIEAIDLTTYYDANNILMFVPNNGVLGADLLESFGRTEGFYFPYNGDTSQITNGSEIQTLIYSSGLVLAGKVNGEVRTAVGMYDSPEYTPGPIDYSAGDSARLITFKLNENSGEGDFDYDNWPADWGAPITDNNPAIYGTQTLWTIFNENDLSTHTNLYGGGTEPLGVEAQLTVWGDSAIDGIVNIQYKLYNRGSENIDSFYICYWVDADIGGPNDDLVGCDSAHDIFYFYNSDAYDYLYQASPPAFGGKVIQGPVIPSPGDTALFDRVQLPDYSNLDMTVFNSYLGGEAPWTPEQLFLCVKGYDCFTGLPLMNPTTGDTTLCYADGNPLDGRGWIDDRSGDKKALVSFGPLGFFPGDSQIVRLRLAAYQSDNNLISLSYLRNLLDSSIFIDSLIDTTEYFAADSAAIIIEDFGLTRVTFDPPKTQWLSGFNWGGRFFQGGFDYAFEFFGSGLDPLIFPDSFHNVEVRFSNLNTQKAFYYLTGTLEPYDYFGYFDVPFTVHDIDNNRQLNVMITENSVYDTFDSLWAPDPANPDAPGEFIFILNSEYGGENPYANSIPYPDYNLLEDADSLDLVYFFWPSLNSGYSLNDMNEGDRLDIVGQFENIDGFPDSVRFVTPLEGAASSRSLMIKCYNENPAKLYLSTSDKEVFRLSTSALRFTDSLPQRIQIDFIPPDDQYYAAILTVYDSVGGRALLNLPLVNSDDLIIDAQFDSPSLLPSKPLLMQNYPNPFNPTTNIAFDLPRRSNVTLTVYNILGQKVKTLLSGSFSAGQHSVLWDGANMSGEPVSSGIYFYRLEADGLDSCSETKKMILIQ